MNLQMCLAVARLIRTALKSVHQSNKIKMHGCNGHAQTSMHTKLMSALPPIKHTVHPLPFPSPHHFPFLHLQRESWRQTFRSSRQLGFSLSLQEQSGTIVCLRRSAQPSLWQGQNNSRWLNSGGTRSRNNLSALWQRFLLQVSPLLGSSLLQVAMQAERCLLQLPLRLQALAASRQGLQFLSASTQWKPFGATVSIPDSGYKEERELSDFSEPKEKNNLTVITLSISQLIENTDVRHSRYT